MIDLHLHTTASDGLCAPGELVACAVAAGLRVISVTDHDTMAALPAAGAAAASFGVAFVPGIELTTIWDGRDVHVLGYFVRSDSDVLAQLIADQRRARLERALAMVALLDRAGAPIDLASRLESAAADGRAIARPELARALVQAGHVASVAEAFDRFLAEGRPAFVPHRGPSPMQAVAAIHAAGGVASLAHPGPLGRDDLLAPLREAGLDAIEAYHSDHDAATQARYAALAERWGLAASGGSDFHGAGARRGRELGRATLPPVAFAALVVRAAGDAGWAAASGGLDVRNWTL